MIITFIGGGNMATALIGGLLRGKFYVPEELCVVEASEDACAKLHNQFSIRATTNLVQSLTGSGVIVLAVKPQQLREVCTQLSPLLSGQLIVSIAAGIRTSDLARWLNTQNIVRCMPNTPALVGMGVTGLYALPKVGAVQREIAENILNAVGSSVWLEEEVMLDGVTAVSGSGPAYVFYFIEAMQQAARELGFNEAQAKSLVIDTFLGATKLAQASPDDVSVLRARVTSKNGTTERALLSMENDSVKQHIVAAVHAAAIRSKEMGDELGSAK
ncbi:MAG: pyrroline-5-carboxylate [Gallionellaceae bacterium]|nr:MAG: pyrroline-5-carboxylate [Gallionellaceae bacterium]